MVYAEALDGNCLQIVWIYSHPASVYADVYAMCGHVDKICGPLVGANPRHPFGKSPRFGDPNWWGTNAPIPEQDLLSAPNTEKLLIGVEASVKGCSLEMAGI